MPHRHGAIVGRPAPPVALGGRLAGVRAGRVPRLIGRLVEPRGRGVAAVGLGVLDVVARSMTSEQGTQTDLAAWGPELEDERTRLDEANERRAARRGFLVFATDPERAPDEPEYREVFATEAKTPGEATAKIRTIAESRRLRTYLATGTYRDELTEARWVA